MKNILIVGGAGYIGSHTVLKLKEFGYNTIIYDNFSTGHKEYSFGHKNIEGDIQNTELLISVLNENNIDCVVHFAALIEAGISVKTPHPFFRNNVAGTISLLDAMISSNVNKLVFSSTAAVYGNIENNELLAETLPKCPNNPYGVTKAMIETVLENYAIPHNFNCIALRYFNAAGADKGCKTGERHNPETHLIPLVIETALGRREEFSIFGTDYNTKDGTCIRDYIHVLDLARGHVSAVGKLLSGECTNYKAINLGTGNGYSVREVIETVESVSGTKIQFTEKSRRSGDPVCLIADPSLAKQILNFKAVDSDITTIVQDAWRFAKNEKI